VLTPSDEIALGMSTAFTGPVAQLDLDIRSGVLATLDGAAMEYRALKEIREHRDSTCGPS